MVHGSCPGRATDLSRLKSLKTALKPTQSHTQWVPRDKRPGHEVDYWPSCNSELSTRIGILILATLL